MTPRALPRCSSLLTDAAFVFLAAESSRYVTGQTLLADDGISTGATRALAPSGPYKPAGIEFKSSYHDKRLLFLTWIQLDFYRWFPQSLVRRIFGSLLTTACLGSATSSSSGHSSDLFRRC